MTLSPEAIADFRDSVREHKGCEKFSDRLAMRSLRSIAVDVPELKEALDTELANPAGSVGS